MWGIFTKSGLQLDQEPLRTDVCKTWVSAVAFLVSSHSWTTDSVISVSPGLKTKRTGLLLSGPKLCSLMKVNFGISFGNQGPRVLRKRGEAQNPRCLRSSVKFPQSVMVWGAMSSAGVVHCVFWGQGQHSCIPGSFRALHASCCWPTLWRCRFHFPTGFGTCTQCQSYQYLFKDHGIPVLNWPANSPDLNP